VYEFDGKKMIGTFFYPPGNGKLGTGFSILTVGNIMSVGCFSDKALLENPQELVDMFININNENITEFKKSK